MSNKQENTGFTDLRGRTAGYLRLSITDRCNLACRYCRGENSEYIPHADILRYEELLRFARIAHSQGVGKIRVTGGEPFMRKGCMEFLLNLRKNLPDTRLCVTTNGVLLEPLLDDLQKMRPESINISLDSLDANDFRKITGKNEFAAVLGNLQKLVSRGMRVKLNAVIMRGITEKQVDGFLNLAREMPVDIRFIEFMPMGSGTLWSGKAFLSAADLETLFRDKAILEPEKDNDKLAGPARMFRIAGAAGRLGFITPISQHFCGICNRIRLTSDGKLRICLFDDREFNLRPLLRHAKITDGQIARVMRLALLRKPIGADLLANRKNVSIAEKKMQGIGG